MDRRSHRVPVPPEAVSQETRRLEFEVQSPESAAGTITVPAYALYYVCEDVDGTCLFRRRDIDIRIEVAPND